MNPSYRKDVAQLGGCQAIVKAMLNHCSSDYEIHKSINDINGMATVIASPPPKTSAFTPTFQTFPKLHHAPSSLHMQKIIETDVAIVGGGGPAGRPVHRLAPTSLDIVILDKKSIVGRTWPSPFRTLPIIRESPDRTYFGAE
jgi:hypothetical protein